jgi:hypothetical protein
MSNTEDKRKNNRGQGMKAEDTFPENWKEIMIDCGKRGKNQTEIFIKLNIHHSTHYDIMERNEEYKDTFEEYLQHCEQWWYDKAHEAVVDGKSKYFNQNLWSMIMRNKFKSSWKDEKQLDVSTMGEKLTSVDPIKIEVIRKLMED